MFLME